MEPLLAFFLFIIVSPGFIVTIPSTGSEIKKINTETTSRLAIIVHTVLFFTLSKLIQNDFLGLGIINRAIREVNSTNPKNQPSDINILFATIFFMIFSPGLILTVFPFSFAKEETSVIAILVHGFAYYLFLKIYDTYKDQSWLSWLDKAIAEI